MALWLGKTEAGRRVVIGGRPTRSGPRLLHAIGTGKSWYAYMDSRPAGEWHWGVNEQFWTWLDGLIGRCP